MTTTVTILLAIIILGTIPFAFADSERNSKLEFAGTLEETLGHFWALEMNLDENNSKLALVHATHPISELYETMNEHLGDNPDFAQKLEQTLFELKDKASTDVTREEAQLAIDAAKEIVQEAREIVVGPELSQDSDFKMQLINGLLETSKIEYKEAIDDGEIVEMAEFQDGSAFVWQSQQIFKSFENDLDPMDLELINGYYEQVWSDFDNRSNPADVTDSLDAIIHEFEELSGILSVESSHVDLSEKKENNASTMALSKMSPKAQMKHGIDSADVQCRQGFELVMKNSDSSAACINSHSVEKLIQRGWASPF